MKILEKALLNKDYEYVRNLERQYATAIQDIESQIAAWYQRFADENGITLAEANRLLAAQELKEFKWTVEEYIEYGQKNSISEAWLKQLKNASARVHISRLDSIKLQLQQQAEVLYGNQLDVIDEMIRRTYSECYYHTAFEIQKGLGVGWSLHGLTDDTIKKVLSRPWTPDGQTFSDRIWSNKQALVNTVNTQLTQMIMRGAAPDTAIKAVADRFKVSKAQAGRLIMTESAAFANEARKDCFNEIGVEQYIIVGTLDNEACSLCGELDGKIYKMSEYEVGSTAPPFHPWCRCTTAPYFADMEGVGERYARDAKISESYKLPRDVKYRQWKHMQDTAYGDGFVDTIRKMGYNEKADKRQWERYRQLLGNDIPGNFTDYQFIKYTNPSLWERYKTKFQGRIGLQQQLAYLWNGEKLFIPSHTKFDTVITIAGAGSKHEIRDVKRLVNEYGGTTDVWKKQAAKVSSDKYIFDVHWYERDDGIQQEVKLKFRKDRKI